MHKAIEFLFPMNAVGWLPSTEYVSEYDQSIRVYHLGAVFTPIGLGSKEMGPTTIVEWFTQLLDHVA